MAKVRIDILESRLIPTLGRGPFHNKEVNEELARTLKRLGYKVRIRREVEDRTIKFKEKVVEETIEETVEEEVIPEVVEETVKEVAPEVVEEDIIDQVDLEDEEVEVFENDFVSSENMLSEEEITRIKDMKKAELKEYLKSKDIEFKYSDTELSFVVFPSPYIRPIKVLSVLLLSTNLFIFLLYPVLPLLYSS